MSAFDQLAAEYDVTWTNSSGGRAQRDIVWSEIDPLFRPGDRVLDLGCGTGEDALHLMERGVRVDAIDASPAMVRVAETRGVKARFLRIEDLAAISGTYDGALSNFGAFNCVRDLAAAGRELARVIRPGGTLAICVMPRVAWAELLRLDLRRWNPWASWRGMRVYYPTTRQIVRAFADFQPVRSRSIALGDHRLYILRRKEPRAR